MKTYDLDFRKGTLIDSVSKTVGINVGNSFAKTEKGIVYRALQSNAGQITYASANVSALNFGANPFTVAIAFKMGKWANNGSSYNSLFGGKADVASVTKGITAFYTNTQVLTFTWGSDGSVSNLLLDDFGSLYDGKFHLALLTFDGTTYKAYLDNIKETTESTAKYSIAFNDFYIGTEEYNPQRKCNSDILFFKAYNTELNSQERNTLYKEFLNSSPTEKEIRGFEYPKPTDLSKENGLVAAYSFSPETVSNGTLLDVSGNGKNGTINGALLTKDGMKFDGVDDYVDIPDLTLPKSTICVRVKLANLTGIKTIVTTGENNPLIILSDNLVYLHGTKLRRGVISSNNDYLNIVGIYNGTEVYMYVSGIEASYTTSASAGSLGSFIGKRTIGSYADMVVSDLKIYNYAFTPQQAKAYHNSFVKPYLLEDFSNHPVLDTSPKGWVKGTGSYKISELTTSVFSPNLPLGTKYLQNTTVGTIAIQSKQAYGEWEFDVMKGADGNNTRVQFVSNKIGIYTQVAGYYFTMAANKALYLISSNGIGGAPIKISTVASYISNNTWYRIKIARLQSEGVFKDIPTLQTSDCLNYTYTTFTSNGRYGFNVTSDGSITHRAGTADEIVIITGQQYLVEFDLKLNSGTAPTGRFLNSFLGSSQSNTLTAVNGKNSHILTATGTTIGVLQFYNSATATDYEISGLTIRRIYDANTFAVFIKGGSFGNDWALVSTTGGSGTNPVTDGTYTTSEYFVADLDAGDKIANIKLINGVKQ